MANWPRKTRSVTIDYDVSIPMRDGVKLAADVFRPAGGDRWPVVIIRTPYDRQLGSSFGMQMNAVQLAAAGYAVVVQDVRGRFASDGDFYPFVNEGQDGVDSIAWCAEQPWSTGKVGSTGSSYVGFVQVLAAKERPDALKAWVPGVTTIDARTGWVYEGDALCLGFDLSWALGLASSDRRTLDPSSLLDALEHWSETTRVPILDNPLFRQPSGQWLCDWVSKRDDAAYWAAQSGFGVEESTAPALQIGGWYDLFHHGSFALHAALAGGNAGSQHRFVMGPWDHGPMPLASGSGTFDFGPRAAFDLTAAQREWFDWLLHEGSEPDWPANRMFITGINRWESFDAWPPPVEPIELALDAHGTLSDLGIGSGEAVFTTAPDDPTPTEGGRLCCALYLLPVGSRWQNARAKRPDVVRFATEAESEPRWLLGPVTADIWSTSDREIGDVHVTLVDIDHRGSSRYLADGIARTHLVPGEPACFHIDLGHVGHVVLPGHRLGIDVAAMSFPRFDVTPTDGRSRRSILFGGEFPSMLTIGTRE
ncbi:MAG: CocE/NonD family hydrolase [Thermomicrobiales bacterium]